MNKNSISQYLSLSGIHIRPAALDEIINFLSINKEISDPEAVLDDLIKKLREYQISNPRAYSNSNILEPEMTKNLLMQLGMKSKGFTETQFNISSLQNMENEKMLYQNEMQPQDETKNELDVQVDNMLKDSIIILDSFTDIPYLEKNKEGKLYIQNRKLVFFPECESKIRMFTLYFDLVEHKLISYSNYSRMKKPGDKSVVLSQVNTVIGYNKKMTVLGMLVSKEDGKVYLEDLTYSIPIKLDNPQYGVGYYPESCIVIAEGVFAGGFFHISKIELPPIINRKITISQLFHPDYFGASTLCRNIISNLNPETDSSIHSRIIRGSEKEIGVDIILVLSNVFLDQQKIISKLRTLLDGFEPICPSMAILVGEFFSKPLTIQQQKHSLEQFANLVGNYQNMGNITKWIFIPGLEDPTLKHLFPKSPFHDSLFEGARKKVKNIILGTNPCRISYKGREIVICRYNAVKQIKKHSLFDYGEKIDDFEKICRTILSQSRICPLQQTVRPVLWDFADSMTYYDLPNFLIVADLCGDYNIEIEGCNCINPGNFSKDFSFIVMYPIKNESQPSKINE